MESNFDIKKKENKTFGRWKGVQNKKRIFIGSLDI
jgi:hypothetical protein